MHNYKVYFRDGKSYCNEFCSYGSASGSDTRTYGEKAEWQTDGEAEISITTIHDTEC